MRKMKRLITLLMTVVMMMAMSITAFATEASEGAQIKIKGADEATFKYVRVIEPDTTSTFGWKIVDAEFKAAIIKELEVTAANPSDKDLFDKYDAASESEKLAVINSVHPTEAMTNPQTVTVKGLYIVQPTEVIAEGASATYEYNNIAVAYNFDGKTDLTVNAKKSPLSPEKKFKNSEDEVVEIKKEVPYEVTFTLPFFAEDDIAKNGKTEYFFGISDAITGGVILHDDAHPVTVTRTDLEKNTVAVNVSPEYSENDTVVDFDLSSLVVAGNTYANQTITLTYTALVTGTQVNNTANFVYKNMPKGEPVKVTSYTGTLQVKKIDSKTNDVLSGAKFVILKKVTEKNADGNDVVVTYYAKLVNNVLDGWTTVKTDASKVTTGENGLSPVVAGFDNQTQYYFQETDAPDGYSVNDEEKAAEWNTPATPDKYAATAVVGDTQLVQLPFTGGMGTTIFTILGVAIMAMAAALFFATKKNHN